MNRRILVAVAVAIFILPACAFGANLDQNRLLEQIPFNLANPGAKSLGLGGAFIGRADDASAAEANPAGLTSITKREATLELRSFETSRNVITGGTNPSFTFGQASDRATAMPSFASVVLPTGAGVYSFYYHRVLNFELQSTNSFIGSGSVLGIAAANTEVDYKAETFGGAAAWKVGGFSVGGALRYQRFEPGTTTIVNPGAANTKTLQIGESDSALSYSAGVRWVTPSENFGIGGVYKKGSDYNVQESLTTASGTSSSPSRFDLPDVYGVGVSFRPAPSLLFNVDAVRVGYSSLLEGFNPALRRVTAEGQPAYANYDVPDVTEIHVGAQWTLITDAAPIAFRAGAWRDPAHGLRYTEPATASTLGPLLQAAYAGGEDVNHISGGIGYLGTMFELNVGYDMADSGDTLAASLLVHF